MILKKTDFILSKINWNEKAKIIIKILKNLNLRFEDCIFIDDNILEIKKVKNRIKKINTLHAKDIKNTIQNIYKDDRFKKIIVSKDDEKKFNQYKLKSKFTEYVSKGTIEPYLIKGLKQKIKIFKCKNSNLKRTEELFNKTNQFNFSLNRYRNNDLLSINKKDNFEIKLFNLKDKFGDHGIIGAYVIRKETQKILIDDFILSCRVLSRFVEKYILCKLQEKYHNKKLEIKFKKTKLNSNLIPKFLKENNFKLLRKRNNIYFYDINFKKKKLNETKKIFAN